MKVALIGSGSIASIHVRALREIAQDIILVQNPSKNAIEFAKDNEINNVCKNFEETKKYDFDFVHICTPANLHYDQILSFINIGKNIISEKPLCLSSDEAYYLYKKAKEKNIVHAVCYNNRFYGAMKYIKEYAKDSLPLFALCSYMQSFHILPTQYSWRYDEAKAGKMRATTEIGSHIIDILRFITGHEINKISAIFQNENKYRTIKDNIMYEADIQNHDIVVNSEDSAVIQAVFDNGFIATITLSETTFGKYNELKFHLHTKHADFEWNCEDPEILKISDKNGNTENQYVEDSFYSSFVSLFKNIYMDDKKYFADFYDGYVNAKVCESIYESANKQGEYVNIYYESR